MDAFDVADDFGVDVGEGKEVAGEGGAVYEAVGTDTAAESHHSYALDVFRRCDFRSGRRGGEEAGIKVTHHYLTDFGQVIVREVYLTAVAEEFQGMADEIGTGHSEAFRAEGRYARGHGFDSF